ncbi:MAG TPA: DUF1080 domain-containing protein [Verrucomicrobiae bacterium]
MTMNLYRWLPRTLSLAFCLLATLAAAGEKTDSTTPLSADEQRAGWRLLFDGQTTQGWRGYRKKEFPKQGWVIEDGCLKKVARVSGGDIVTGAEFEDFEFAWEWKLPPKANNGVKYLVLESRPGAPGPEYQMIDDTLVGNPLQKTASFYEVLPPGPNAKPKPMGEWNQSRIVVRGNHVEHWLNGEKVLAYELGSPEVKAGVAKSKFKNAPGFGEKCRGRILLTDHNDEAWYRNLKVREFPAAKP